MKIKELTIKDLYDEYNFHWELNYDTSHDVNILAGQNGSFKSTLLKLIYLFSKEYKENTISNLVKEIDIQFTDGYAVKYETTKRFLTINDKFINVNGGFYTIPSSTYNATKDGKELKIDDFQKLVKIDDISTFDKSFEGNILDGKLKDLVSKYGFYMYDLSKQITDSIGEKGTLDKEELSKIKAKNDLFISIINEAFSHSGKSVNQDKSGLEFKNKKGKSITIDLLSSGEKQYLIIMLTTLLENEEEYIMLLDEPEISLDIEWQEKLIENIEKLNPNCQILLATHSPGVILNGWEDMVTEMDSITTEQ